MSEKRSPAAAPPVKTLSALYTRPYQCHASIGPSCAVAQWQGGKLTVWTHSQGVFPLRADLAKVFGVDGPRTSAASTPRAPAATATTAPTTWPSTRRWWRAPPAAGR